MESSSDESFAWAKESKNSNYSSDSDNMAHEEESDFDKNYKKKLKKQLFENGDVDPELEPTRDRKRRIKQEPISDAEHTPRKRTRTDLPDEKFLQEKVKEEQANNVDPDLSTIKKKKKKKRDRKSEDDSQENIEDSMMDLSETGHSLLLQKVKEEKIANDELNHSTKKKKKKKREHKSDDEFHENNASLEAHSELEESLLLRKVKEEKTSPDEFNHIHIEKKKKERKSDKHPNENNEDTPMELSRVSDVVDSVKRKKKKLKEEKERRDENDVKLEDTSRTADVAEEELRKKKKKQKVESFETDNYVIEEKFSAEETEVETRPHSPLRNGDIQSESTNNYKSREFIEDDNSTDEEESRKPTSGETQSITNQRKTSESSTNSEGPKMVDQKRRPSGPSTTWQKNDHGSKISDRIMYEEDSDAERALSSAKEVQASAMLRRYLSAQPALRAAAAPAQRLALSADDDLWLLTAPRALSAAAASLRGRDITIDAHCKLEVDGQKYEGVTEDAPARIPLLVHRDEFAIKNLPLCGSVRFHPKIPKPRFVEETSYSPPDRIPLPETKLRHPLLGADYRRLARVPRAARLRLRQAADPAPSPAPSPPPPSPPPTETSVKKKKKKHKRSRDEPDAPAEPAELAEEAPRPRKRKRESAQGDAEPSESGAKKRSKKEKRRLDSAEVWESEKAIEENLFDF